MLNKRKGRIVMFYRKPQNPESLDLLQQKETKLAQLMRKSEFSIQTVRQTIDDLNQVNEEIDQTMSEISGYIERLQDTKDGLNATRGRNTKIMANFQKLLCLDE